MRLLITLPPVEIAENVFNKFISRKTSSVKILPCNKKREGYSPPVTQQPLRNLDAVAVAMIGAIATLQYAAVLSTYTSASAMTAPLCAISVSPM